VSDRMTAPKAPGAEIQNSRTLLGEWSRNALNLRIRGVYIVHILGFGPGRSWVESGRIPHVSAGVQCLRGRECSSSPTSGTAFPSSEGFLLNVCTLTLFGSL
jgi:hypothetical protein